MIGPSLGPCRPKLGGGVLLAEILELGVAGNVDARNQVKLKISGAAVLVKTEHNELQSLSLNMENGLVK